ncbi:lactate utilization protein [uncultured Selenomonas sp.]|uniref:lactate utilization protein n=1 Tax=uncultured Selenomonas sp. TaxID=159275 RepID=UPI0025DD4DED|nr:lactate utilization protein [uncultured Selenomonas sp.]
MDFTKLAAALRKREYEVSCFETSAEAANYLDAQIDGVTVGFGDSLTLKSLGIYERLSKHNTVYDPAHPQDGMNFYTTALLCLTTDVFLCSVNGIAQTGEMVNIDGTGNRVAGSLYGHKKVYFVAGANKVLPTLEEAAHRARNSSSPTASRTSRSIPSTTRKATSASRSSKKTWMLARRSSS